MPVHEDPTHFRPCEPSVGRQKLFHRSHEALIQGEDLVWPDIVQADVRPFQGLGKPSERTLAFEQYESVPF
jgi:hypothetical protein